MEAVPLTYVPDIASEASAVDIVQLVSSGTGSGLTTLTAFPVGNVYVNSG